MKGESCDDIFYRAVQDFPRNGWPEGSCITEEQYIALYYLDKLIFEPVRKTDFELGLIYEDGVYCAEKKIEFSAFYSQKEFDLFYERIGD